MWIIEVYAAGHVQSPSHDLTIFVRNYLEIFCVSLNQEGGVRALVEVCRRENVAFTRSKALRALATICCVPECVAELEKVSNLARIRICSIARTRI